ncbi:Mediator-associated protein 1 [Apostasia shenzhenica]|uniref:Mediator-associated protein 1 n=1 Tax=Apostasia shenzhenica TaxID=1088818 RepID=A0A2I0AGE7_9ASPA|nr:Mediator-associated protein 1 [Apostasia shenzhenica]
MAQAGEKKLAVDAFDDDDELDYSDMDCDDEEESSAPLTRPPPIEEFSSSAPISVNNPTPSLNHNSVSTQQNGSITTVPVALATQIVSAAVVEDSRRMFHRLWTDEDEITILQGFLEFTTHRGTTHASHQYDTGPFYEQMKENLRLDFNKNQLIEKLRRLKKKYRNVVSRMVSGKDFAFKSAHQQATFEISRRIWSASIKSTHDSDGDEFTTMAPALSELDHGAEAADSFLNYDRSISRSARRLLTRSTADKEVATAAAAASDNGAAVEVPVVAPPAHPSDDPTQSVVEETVKRCLTPLIKELVQTVIAGPGICSWIDGGSLLGLDLLHLGIGSLPHSLTTDEKWRNQQILELEVHLKRIELMRDQVKSILKDLKSEDVDSF